MTEIKIFYSLNHYPNRVFKSKIGIKIKKHNKVLYITTVRALQVYTII